MDGLMLDDQQMLHLIHKEGFNRNRIYLSKPRKWLKAVFTFTVLLVDNDVSLCILIFVLESKSVVVLRDQHV